jgi:ribose 5-phosphate isomerase B
LEASPVHTTIRKSKKLLSAYPKLATEVLKQIMSTKTIALACDHAGLLLKSAVRAELEALGFTVLDFGVDSPDSVDFPDYAALVGQAIQQEQVERGILLCGSGVGMAIAANKMRGVRASVAHDIYSAHQGVEHDSMNVLCLGSRVIGEAVARELVRAFVQAEFDPAARFQRRLDKINSLESAAQR